MPIRVGIDVGGTFTDVTALDEDKAEIVLIRKYTSNANDPMQVMAEITRDLQAAFGAEAVTLILHGSTAALNTLLEDKGVRVGLCTTCGFRDVYEIGRQWRGEDVFNIFAPGPKMLLDRDRIVEVRERLDFWGSVLVPLDHREVEHGARQLLAQGVEAIAIVFLFAYANPAHERAAAAIIRSLAPGLYLSLSSEVNPEWREYERTATTVANAYIGPRVARYLHALEDLSHTLFPHARMLMMKSDGGAASAALLEKIPIQTVMSGPVAGVIGARYLGDHKRIENLITFDIGGTSSDMAVLPGPPLLKSEIAVARHPLRTRTIDIDTIGAGGGSIASIELGGVLKVGPQSAGAVPGPACYGRGGTAPTLTDALVVLGHLSATALLGGAMPISYEKARAAVDRHLAAPLGMTAQQAAWGVLTVLATNCMSAMRTITVERGYDPREFTLVPFGGMGPTIAGRIAAELGIGRILIPRDPGAFSAWGMLVSDVRHEQSRTRITPLDEVTPEIIEQLFAELETHAVGELMADKLARERISTLRTAAMRYRGQSYEITVPVKAVASRSDIDALVQAFHEAHRRRYGHMALNEAVEIVSFTVTGVGSIAKPKLKPALVRGIRSVTPLEMRAAYFGGDAALDTPVFRRADFDPGASLCGPAIIEEETSTIVLAPGHSAVIDEFINVEITVAPG
jgi:N-methylhydantoinase A